MRTVIVMTCEGQGRMRRRDPRWRVYNAWPAAKQPHQERMRAGVWSRSESHGDSTTRHHKLNACSSSALSPNAVDVAWQHLIERFPASRMAHTLAPRGTHSCAPPTTFARPAHPILARLLGRRPSFVHSSPWIPPTHPSLPFPPLRTEQAILEDHR